MNHTSGSTRASARPVSQSGKGWRRVASSRPIRAASTSSRVIARIAVSAAVVSAYGVSTNDSTRSPREARSSSGVNGSRPRGSVTSSSPLTMARKSSGSGLRRAWRSPWMSCRSRPDSSCRGRDGSTLARGWWCRGRRRLPPRPCLDVIDLRVASLAIEAVVRVRGRRALPQPAPAPQAGGVGRRAVALALAASCVLALAGCAQGSGPPRAVSGSTAGSASPHASTGHTYLVGTEDYLPGRAADLYLPDSSGPSPLVVMVPGGGWLTAERGGLAPLAEALARDGVSVVNATHRAVDQGGRFPQMVADVLCSVSWAVARVTALRDAPSLVVLLGHSSGAHLAALAALGPADLATGCPYPPAHIDGLVGLSGTYDVSQLVDLATPFFGASPGQDPDAWRAGNPLTWAGAAGASPCCPCCSLTAARTRRSRSPSQSSSLPRCAPPATRSRWSWSTGPTTTASTARRSSPRGSWPGCERSPTRGAPRSPAGEATSSPGPERASTRRQRRNRTYDYDSAAA